jgi:hypothetical protein
MDSQIRSPLRRGVKVESTRTAHWFVRRSKEHGNSVVSAGDAGLSLQRARKLKSDSGVIPKDVCETAEGFSLRPNQKPCPVRDVARSCHEDSDLSSSSGDEVITDDTTECSDSVSFKCRKSTRSLDSNVCPAIACLIDEVPCRSNNRNLDGKHKGDGSAKSSESVKSKGPMDLTVRLGQLELVGSAAPSNSLSRQSLKKKKRVSFKVSFTTVEVRQYNRIVSDHPECTGGPPIGIGWEHTRGKMFDLSQWEDMRCELEKPAELKWDRAKREKILRAWGFGDKEFAAAVRALNKARAQRQTTVRNLGVQKMEETFEQASRKMKSWLLLGKV